MGVIARSALLVLMGISIASCGGSGGGSATGGASRTSTSSTGSSGGGSSGGGSSGGGSSGGGSSGGGSSGGGTSACSPTPPPTTVPIPAVYVADSSPSNIAALAIDENSGALRIIPGSPFPSDGGLYAVAIDPAAPFAYAASSMGGYLRVYSVSPTTGGLTELSCGPYFTSDTLVSIAIDPHGEFLFTAGGPASVAGFSINGDGSLSELPGSPFATGSNPLAVAFDPVAPFLYVANSQDDTITAYSYSTATSQFTQVPGSPFTTDGPVRLGGHPQSLAIDPSGKFLFSANFMGSDISVFRIDSTSGALSAVPGSPFVTNWGAWELVVDKTGNFLYLASGDNKVHTFSIDPNTGALTEPFLNPYILNASLTALSIDSSGKYLFAVDNVADDVVAYSINSNTGALSLVPGDPFPLVPGVQGLGPTVITVGP